MSITREGTVRTDDRVRKTVDTRVKIRSDHFDYVEDSAGLTEDRLFCQVSIPNRDRGWHRVKIDYLRDWLNEGLQFLDAVEIQKRDARSEAERGVAEKAGEAERSGQ